MPRLMFTKAGNAVWISHLDTMRLFQRAFKRCGFHLQHTQGFNPRPSVSIALPLSVGVESLCEILDFELEDEGICCQDVMDRLNDNLVDGICVTAVYENGTKIKYLKYLKCEIEMHYDGCISDTTEDRINSLFQQSELWMEKKGKNGLVRQNIIPMIQSLNVTRLDAHALRICAVIYCQEPSLNPSQISSAVAKYLPDCLPDDVRCRRCELYDASGQVFR